jgi:hypothetical protein
MWRRRVGPRVLGAAACRRASEFPTQLIPPDAGTGANGALSRNHRSLYYSAHLIASTADHEMLGVYQAIYRPEPMDDL